jgi:hypothetical protein
MWKRYASFSMAGSITFSVLVGFQRRALAPARCDSVPFRSMRLFEPNRAEGNMFFETGRPSVPFFSLPPTSRHKSPLPQRWFLYGYAADNKHFLKTIVPPVKFIAHYSYCSYSSSMGKSTCQSIFE